MEIVGYNNNPLTYDGKFISAFEDGFSDLIPDCIIKRNSGVSMRPALATKYSAGMETATPTDIHFANAFSSPYLYKKKVNFNTCTILPVTSGSASTELGKAVYYNYPPSSTDYIYFHLNSSGEYDLTNAGSVSYNRSTYTPGESEVVRLKFLGQSTGPSFNLSDFTAVRNVYMPNLTAKESIYGGLEGGIHGIFQYYGTIEDGDTNNATPVGVRYPSSVVKELENFYVPTAGSGGCDDWGAGWYRISSVKNVAFNTYTVGADVRGYGHFPGLKYMENLTANVRIGWDEPITGLTVRGDNLSAQIYLTSGDVWGNVSACMAATASIVDGKLQSNLADPRDPSAPRFSACKIGFREPTTVTLEGGVKSGVYRTDEVPPGTYSWSVATGFYLGGYPVFADCTAGNVSVIVE